MQKHPDADAFVLEHLRRPTDATTRLVFADWLEETGARSNVAWAHYIRLREEADRDALDPVERFERFRRADEHAPGVRAKLALAGRVLARNPGAVLQLIPAANVTVRLANFVPPRELSDRFPESVAREDLALPLAMCGPVYVIATVLPHSPSTAARFGFFFSRQTVFVRATPDELRAAIDRTYGGPIGAEMIFTEFVDTGTPLLAHADEEITPVVRLVNLLLAQTVGRADAVRFDPTPDALLMRERVRGVWADREPIPLRLLRPVVARLAVLADIGADEVFAPPRTVYPLDGVINFQAQSARFRIGVTAHPSPDAPTIELAITEVPA